MVKYIYPDINGNIVEVDTIPRSVTPLQARKALLQAGLLPQVEAAVTAAGGDVQIAWEYGLEVHRDSPLIASLGASLGLTGEQIDQLFETAASL